MGDARWELKKRILNELLERPEEQREGILLERCEGDELLLAELRHHLSEVAKLGSFLDDPSHLQALPATVTPASSPLLKTVTMRKGTGDAEPIGGEGDHPRYKITRFLGRGGFGEVYQAQQLSPVRRTVALKFLHASSHHLRFEAERQALALLSHDGIAKLLDAGTMPDGRLYYSMEYVEGATLDTFCDQREFDLRTRLEIFRRICDAMQHAHLRGIVHRDLKPDNILVAEQDGVPMPRVIDLGLAKSLEEPLSEKLGRSQDGIAGTLLYMSPEQSRGKTNDVDVRTDVYSLGVILHELLIGARPLEFPSESTYDECLKIIREVEPLRPSARFRNFDPDRRQRVAEIRRISADQLERTLESELDWIVLKALEKDKKERYQSAGELSEELRRYLDHEPVLAVRPTLSYQVRKFVRRNRGAVTAAAAILITGIIGLSSTAAFWAVAREEGELSQLLTDWGKFEATDKALAGEEFWPIHPSIAAPLAELQGELAEIASREEHYRTVIEDLAAATSPADKFRRERAAEVLSAIGSTAVSDRDQSLFAEIEWRRERAATLEERTVAGEAARKRWEKAREEIADSELCPHYVDMPEVSPQLGLLPLGVDPNSKLYEFWHVLSGQEPTRGENGHIKMTPESGIVLVLLPGGEFRMGCDPPLGFHVRPGLVVTQVPEWSPAFGAGINPDDQLVGWRVDGESGGLGDLVRKLAAEGGSVDFAFAGSQGTERHAIYEIPPPGADDPYEPNAQYGEGPADRVELHPFFVSKFEMTQAQWDRWAGANPSVRKAGVGKRSPRREYTWDQPVEGMSWNDARSILSQMGLKLPTEAQWEYSCRSGTRTAYNTGGIGTLQGHANISDIAYASRKSGAAANAKWDDGFVYAAPVGSYPANSFGLHDTHGNIWEWCEDSAAWYSVPAREGDGLRVPVDDSFTEQTRDREGSEADSETRIIRGGGFKNKQDHARSAYRWPYILAGDEDIGVRPVRALDLR